MSNGIPLSIILRWRSANRVWVCKSILFVRRIHCTCRNWVGFNCLDYRQKLIWRLSRPKKDSSLERWTCSFAPDWGWNDDQQWGVGFGLDDVRVCLAMDDWRNVGVMLHRLRNRTLCHGFSEAVEDPGRHWSVDCISSSFLVFFWATSQQKGVLSGQVRWERFGSVGRCTTRVCSWWVPLRCHAVDTHWWQGARCVNGV